MDTWLYCIAFLVILKTKKINFLWLNLLSSKALDSRLLQKLAQIRLNLLIEERKLYEGNTTCIYVMAILSIEYWDRQHKNADSLGLLIPDVSKAVPKYVHQVGLSAKAMSDISGIPRTTIVRALKKLEKMDLAKQTDVGWYTNVHQARTVGLDMYTTWYNDIIKTLK